MSTSSLRQCMAGPFKFSAVAAGSRFSVDDRDRLISGAFTFCSRNFEPKAANFDWILDHKHLSQLSSLAQSHICINDRNGQDGSGWGYCSLLQLKALEKKELTATYANAQFDSTGSQQAVSKSSNTVPDSSIPPDDDEKSTDSDADSCPVSETIFDEPFPKNREHLEEIVDRFCRTSEPLTLASFAVISFMDKGSEVSLPYIQYLSNHRSPGLKEHLDRMESGTSFRPDRLAQAQVRDWIYKAACSKNKAVTSCSIVMPDVFDAVFEHQECRKLAFTRGDYRGTLDAEKTAVDSVPIRLSRS